MGGAEDGEDGGDLVEFVLAGEERVLGVELEQDAADTPDVHLLGVKAISQQALGRSIPARGDILGEGRLRVHI